MFKIDLHVLQDTLRRLRPSDSEEGLVALDARTNMEVTRGSQQTEGSPVEQKVVPNLELWSHHIGFGAVVSLCSGARRGNSQPLGSEG